MKKLLSVLLAMLMVFALVGCSGGNNDAAPADGGEPGAEGQVFNIWTWNDEFWNWLGNYYADEKVDEYTLKKGDVTIVRTTYPSDGGAYQDALDTALLNQANAPADEKVDMFLAEADYIVKYTNSDATQDIKALGVTDFSNAYAYTVQAASDANGVVKGASMQCCPSALIYRRSIALDVLGTDDPDEVQSYLDSWDKFNDVAAQAKEKGYYMVATVSDDYRVFSNNAEAGWVVDGKLYISDAINAWIDQAEEFNEKGYAAYPTSGIWDDAHNSEMLDTGKTMCFFGPAWYFNFCMGNAMETCPGDWAICKGPQGHFWGGTWMLAATGSDNPTMIADIINTFLGEEVSEKLVVNDAQFSNNKKVNEKYAADPSFGNAFLGGQNDTALFASMSDSIVFANPTNYDQGCNEAIQRNINQYLEGTVNKETAIANFKDEIRTMYPALTVE